MKDLFKFLRKNSLEFYSKIYIFPNSIPPVAMLWDAKRNKVVIVTFVVFLFLNNSRVKEKTNFM